MKNSVLVLFCCCIGISISSAQDLDYTKKSGAYKFSIDGQRVPYREAVTFLESYPESQELIQKAANGYGFANVVAVVGGGLIGWPLGTAIGGGDPE